MAGDAKRRSASGGGRGGPNAPRTGARLSAIRIGWRKQIPDGDRRTPKELADILAGIVQEDASYISHGEYFEGLSPDARRWAGDLARRYRAHVQAILTGKDKLRRLAEARAENGDLAGLAIIALKNNGTEACWVIEDLAVPLQHRRKGVGRAFIDFFAAEAARAGARKLLLESGAENHGAHALFKKAGFNVFSKVFMRDL